MGRLTYSANRDRNIVMLWDEGTLVADLTNANDGRRTLTFDQKLERAREIVNAVNRLRRIERAGEMARSQR